MRVGPDKEAPSGRAGCAEDGELALWVLGRLEGEGAARLERHAARCPVCKDAARIMRAIHAQAQSGSGTLHFQPEEPKP